LGSAVAEVLAKHFPAKMEICGQLDTFGESGKPEELKAKYHMTAQDIVEAAKKLRNHR
jgi:transketolase